MKKNTRSADFCADRIDIISNFAVITNVVIKRVHCNCIFRVEKYCNLPVCLSSQCGSTLKGKNLLP